MIRFVLFSAVILSPIIARAQVYTPIPYSYPCEDTVERKTYVSPTPTSPGYVKTWIERIPASCVNQIPVVAPYYPYRYGYGYGYYRTPACGSSTINVLGIPILGSTTICQ